MLERLTDAYNKKPDGNLGKMLSIVASELSQLQSTLNTVETYRDIDQAEGNTLDRIGQNVQQFRGQAEDPVYRILIKSKIARNLSDGSVNTLIDTLTITLNTDPENVEVDELYNHPSNPEPAAVFVSVPAERLNEVGLSLSQFGRLTNRIVAAGVRAEVLFEGTFQFSSSYDSVNIDNEKGFNELIEGEPGDVGGFLGAIYDPADDPDLPM